MDGITRWSDVDASTNNTATAAEGDELANLVQLPTTRYLNIYIVSDVGGDGIGDRLYPVEVEALEAATHRFFQRLGHQALSPMVRAQHVSYFCRVVLRLPPVIADGADERFASEQVHALGDPVIGFSPGGDLCQQFDSILLGG